MLSWDMLQWPLPLWRGGCVGRLRVNAHKNRPKSPISGTSRKIDFACNLPIDRS